tara:strand:- start:899 stop:1003 length:105 start_codon:yes stop_codon:yes gene_type:complete
MSMVKEEDSTGICPKCEKSGLYKRDIDFKKDEEK